MSHDDYIRQLSYAKDMSLATDTLGIVVSELLALHTAKFMTYEQSAPPSCMPLYKEADKSLCGAHVIYKPGDVPSFVHEMTHAACAYSYNSDLINYKPKTNPAGVPARVYSDAAHPKAMSGTRFCKNETARRKAWYDETAAKFLTLNLGNLEKWLHLTDFTTALPWLEAHKAEELARKQAAAGTSPKAAADFFRDQSDVGAFGLVIKPAKKSEQKSALEAEKNKKRLYIQERINYGRSGMGGQGDVHFEYDTVLNQMMYQMFMWGFRPVKPMPEPSLNQMTKWIKARKVPATYLYTKIDTLALDAHNRRKRAKQIASGQAPSILGPTVVINPPKER